MIKCPNCGNEFTPSKNGRGGVTECCSQPCAAELKSKRNYQEYLKDNSIADGKRNMQSFKKFFLEEQEHKCSICGIDDT